VVTIRRHDALDGDASEESKEREEWYGHINSE